MSALRVHILLLACVVLGSGEVEKAKDGRVVLNLGFLTSKTGGFVSAGTYCGILGERRLCVRHVPPTVGAAVCVL